MEIFCFFFFPAALDDRPWPIPPAVSIARLVRRLTRAPTSRAS
jgi:hypothetical protein